MFPTGVDTISADLSVETVRAQFGWTAGLQVVLHAGNLGLKQGLTQVVDAARLAARRGDPVRFVFSGGGSQTSEIRAAAEGLPNVEFLGLQPDAMHANLLAAADVLLLSERASQVDMSLPSKLTAYFAAGRPILAAVGLEGGSAAEVERSGAGIVVPAGQPVALLEALARLREASGLAAELAAAGTGLRRDTHRRPPVPRTSREPRGPDRWPRPRSGRRRAGCRMTHRGCRRQEGADHRHHRPGRLVPRRAPAGEGLRGPRADPSLEPVQHAADRPPLRGSARGAIPASSCTTPT